MTKAGDTSNFHDSIVKRMTESMYAAIQRDGEVYQSIYIHVSKMTYKKVEIFHILPIDNEFLTNYGILWSIKYSRFFYFYV